MRIEASFYNSNNQTVKSCEFHLVNILFLLLIPTPTALVQDFMTSPSTDFPNTFLDHTNFSYILLNLSKANLRLFIVSPWLYNYFSSLILYTRSCMVCPHPISRTSSAVTYPHSLPLHELPLFPQTHHAAPCTLVHQLSLPSVAISFQNPKLTLLSSS